MFQMCRNSHQKLSSMQKFEKSFQKKFSTKVMVIENGPVGALGHIRRVGIVANLTEIRVQPPHVLIQLVGQVLNFF